MLLKTFQLSFYEELISVIKENHLDYYTKSYDKHQIIFLAQTKCEKIGIIINGKAVIENVLESGKKNTIKQLDKYDIFGEILLFAQDQHYPYNIIAQTKCEILFITKDTLFKIFKLNINIMEKYLIHISNSYMLLNKYIKLRTQKTLTSKIAFYLVNYLKINSNISQYKITTKTQIADLLGVERQSLIRELNKLKEQSILNYDKDYIYIVNYNAILELIE